MDPEWPRRSLLSGLGTAVLVGLAGCSDSLASSRGATDIILHNESTNALSIDVYVTGKNADEPRIDTTVDLDPNMRHDFNNKVLMNSDYNVQVTFADSSADESEYSETYEWTNADQPLHVLMNDQIVFAVQVS